MGWTIQGLNASRGKRFSLLQNLQTGSGAHPTCDSEGTRVLSLGIKWLGHKADHSHLVLRLRMSGAVSPVLHAFMVCPGTTLPFKVYLHNAFFLNLPDALHVLQKHFARILGKIFCRICSVSVLSPED
jgi:hypothetical protein